MAHTRRFAPCLRRNSPRSSKRPDSPSRGLLHEEVLGQNEQAGFGGAAGPEFPCAPRLTMRPIDEAYSCSLLSKRSARQSGEGVITKPALSAKFFITSLLFRASPNKSR